MATNEDEIYAQSDETQTCEMSELNYPSIEREGPDFENTERPISCIPAEVLSQIFFLFLDTSLPGQLTYSALPLIHLSQVCRFWRAAALDCPELWTQLDFSYPELTQTMLQRSRNAPLTVAYRLDFRLPSVPEGRCLDILRVVLSQHLSRLRSVRLFVPYMNHPLSTLLSEWIHPLPILEEFTISGQWIADVQSRQDFPDEFLQQAPALLHLNLSCQWATEWSRLPLSRTLRHMELGHSHTMRLPPSTTDFIESLAQLPQLQALGLYDILPSSEDEQERKPISLPTLRQLWLIDEVDEIIHFFKIARIPDTASVSVVIDRATGGTDIEEGLDGVLEQLHNSKEHDFDNPQTADSLRVSGISFDLCFAADEQNAATPNLSVSLPDPAHSGYTPPVDVHGHMEVLQCYVDFSQLQSLEVEDADVVRWHHEAWKFFGRLPSLKVVTFKDTPLVGFLDVLEEKPDPPILHKSTTPAPYFPALSILCLFDLRLDDEDYEVDMQEFSDCLIKILKKRVKCSHPLSELHIETLRHFNAPEVARLRRAVPSLRVVWDGYETDSSHWPSSSSSSSDNESFEDAED